MLLAIAANAQEKITVNITQDAKLLFAGDYRGNSAGTIDVAIRSEWQGVEQRNGFAIVAPEFEYADLKGGIYRRYSANAGYTFTWIDNVHFTATGGWGFIDYNGGYTSFGANLQTAIKVLPGVYFLLDLETTERKDLLQWSSTEVILGTAFRVSGKFGLRIELFNTKYKR